MLRLLQSIFGGGETTVGYPESLVKQAIERAVDGTDPWLRSISGYKKKLRPAVVSAIDHVIALVNKLPDPLPLDVQTVSDTPLLKAFFTSSNEMRRILATDRNLAIFMREAAVMPEKTVVLLVMEMNENVILGAELSGDIIIRDVPQKTVNFDAHRLIDPSGEQIETRRLLMRRAFDLLIRFALKRISKTKMDRKYLERRQALLRSKLNVLERGEWGFESTDSCDPTNISELEEQLRQIELQILDIGGDDRILDAYLDIVTEVLGRPGEHLWSGQETLILDTMGIRRNQLTANAHELTFPVIYTSDGHRFVASLIALSGTQLSSLPGT